MALRPSRRGASPDQERTERNRITRERSERSRERHERIDELALRAYALRRTDPAESRRLTDEAHMRSRGASYERGIALALRNEGANDLLSGRLERGELRLREAITQLELQREDEPLGVAFLELGSLLVELGREGEAKEYLDRSLRRARRAADRRLEAETLIVLGAAAAREGETEQANDHLRAALVITDDLQEENLRARALLVQAALREQEGEIPKAMLLLRRAQEASAAAGDRYTEVAARREIARLHGLLEDDPGALDAWSGALVRATEIDDVATALAAHGAIAAIYRRAGETTLALDSLNRRLELARASGSRYEEASALNSCGNVHYRLRDYDRALVCYGDALGVAREAGLEEVEEVCLENLANVYRDSGSFAEAVEHYTACRRIASQRGHREGTASCYLNLGLLGLDKGDLSSAIQHLNTAQIAARDSGADQILGETALELARIYERRRGEGDLVRANEQLRLYIETMSRRSGGEQRRLRELVSQRIEIERQRAATSSVSTPAIATPTEAAASSTPTRHAEATYSTSDGSTVERQNPAPTLDDVTDPDQLIDYGYIAELSRHHKELSKGELRICALIRAGLNTPQMAQLLGVSDRAVEKHRYKARRKIGLDSSVSLSDWVLGQVA